VRLKIAGIFAVILGLLYYYKDSSSQHFSIQYDIVWPITKKIDLTSWYQEESTALIVIYMGAADWEELEPWLHYWEAHSTIKGVILVDYGEEERSLWDALPKNVALTKTWGTRSFDGSVFRVISHGTLPAAYLIYPKEYARGPFDYYHDIPVSVRIFEA
jgi:non-ribosomal peptide synthetase component E (peptide arylation enzyme)